MLSQLGRYQVDELLVRGGMGEVYLGRLAGAHDFERPVAIKVIRSELVSNERAALMFVDEARIAAGLHHRNIVQIIDFDRFADGAFIVSELIDGCDLRRFLAAIDGPPKYSIAITIIAELGTGLHAAHEAAGADGAPLNLVHRDVSPSNVLLGKHGEIKLADFGVAKARSRSYHTISGTIKGKAAYMAPEQILGEPLDRRTDVFALGVLLFEVATRTRLFSGLGDAQAMKAILGGQLPEPAERRSGFPPALASIIRKATTRQREDRYATTAEVVADLDAVARRSKWSLSCAAVGDLVKKLGRK